MKTKTILFVIFTAVLLLTVAACGGTGPDTPGGGTEATAASAADTTAAAVPDAKSDYLIAEDGRAVCAIAVAENAGKTEKAFALSLQLALKNDFGIQVEVNEKVGSDTDPEIVIGLGAYAPGADIYSGARYGAWTAARCGYKLLVFACDEKTYGSASGTLPKYIKRMSGDGIVKLGSVFFASESVVPSPVNLPVADGFCASYVNAVGWKTTAHKAVSVTFKNANESDFKAYQAKLETLSFRKAAENGISGNLYATYVNEKNQLSVDYFPAMRIMRVIGEPAYEKPLWELSGGERVQPVKLMMIEDTTSGHASSFVVTLADGRFLLYDTGYDTTADQLMNYMKANNRFSDGKVHIAAIIISHPHTDHMDGLTALADKYSAQIECGAVMYNLVSTDMQSVLADSSLDSRQKSFNDAAEKLGAEVYCLRGGQKFEFAGTTFEVMFTADELGDFELTGVNSSGQTDTTYDMNNSSLILRMTESGQTTVFTGDCRGGEAGIISSMFSAGFDADMMTVAHHGFNVVGTLWMYNKARPKVLFWTIKSADADTSRSFVQQLMSARYVKKHFYEDTQTEIVLPYDPAS